MSSTFGKSASDTESVICLAEVRSKYEEIIENNNRKIKRLETEVEDLRKGLEVSNLILEKLRTNTIFISNLLFHFRQVKMAA